MYNQERRKKLELASVRIASSVLLLDTTLRNMGICRYIQTGYLLLGCPGPWRLAIRNLPFCLLGDVAYGPGLTAGTVVSGPSPCYSGTGAPTSPGRLERSRVAPDQGGPGPPRVMAGPSQARPLRSAPGDRTPPPLGKGSGAAACRPAVGAGPALPRACG
jgi:hypothetical protein